MALTGEFIPVTRQDERPPTAVLNAGETFAVKATATASGRTTGLPIRRRQRLLMALSRHVE